MNGCGRGVEALKRGDVAAFGRLMSASHASSRDDFENSSPALDALIEAAETGPWLPGGQALGRRLGRLHGQPGACRARRRFCRGRPRSYSRKTGITPEIHICRAADGAFGLDLVPSGS